MRQADTLTPKTALTRPKRNKTDGRLIRKIGRFIRSRGFRGRAALTLRDFIVKTHGVSRDPAVNDDSMFFAYSCVKPGSHADFNLELYFDDFSPMYRMKHGSSEVAITVPLESIKIKRRGLSYAHLRFLELSFSGSGKFETASHWVADFWFQKISDYYPTRGIQIVDFSFSCNSLGYCLNAEQK